MDLRVLLRQHARTGDASSLHAVRLTLDKMARGGIYDHLGGGFARYSTDDRWLVPHFEKMLYDNALLSTTYLEAYQATRDPEYARVARETMDYILGRMTSPEGGFYATEDADSEGVEGKYYVWSLDEVKQVLGGEKAKTFAYVYDVTEHGNWDETNILNLPKTIAQAAGMLGRDEKELRAELAEGRARLLAVRDRRVPPGEGHEGPDLVERADARPAGRGVADARRRALPRRRPQGRGLPARPDGRRPTAACSTATRTARRSSTATSTTTPT